MRRRPRLTTLLWATVLVVGSALAVAELAMDLTSSDRTVLYVVFGLMATLTGATAVVALRWAPRMRSLLVSMRIVAFAAVVVAAGAVAASAVTMFIEPHDLTLVLVALVLGVGLGGVLAVAVAGPLTTDLERLAGAARRVGEGDLSATTGIGRRDELGRAAAAFDGMTLRLAEAERAKDDAEQERRALIASVGHDLRTPLASLQAALEAVEDGVAPDPQRYLQGMASDLDHLRRLVDDLFLLSRLDAGRYLLSPEVVDLGELVDEAVEALMPLSRERGVELRATVTGSILVEVDPSAIGRILRNLVDNSLRHTPGGGRVEVELTGNRDWATLSVADTGPGFPPGLRSRVFERLSSGESARRSGGGSTGLGLSIAYELARLSGGQLELADGPGARVDLSLPVV